MQTFFIVAIFISVSVPVKLRKESENPMDNRQGMFKRSRQHVLKILSFCIDSIKFDICIEFLESLLLNLAFLPSIFFHTSGIKNLLNLRCVFKLHCF